MAESSSSRIDKGALDQRGEIRHCSLSVIILRLLCYKHRRIWIKSVFSIFRCYARRQLLQEDDNVCDLVGKHGMKSWSFIARQLKGRLGKQCRERWYNHLNPDINRAPWSAEEDAMIIEVSVVLLEFMIVVVVVQFHEHIEFATAYYLDNELILCRNTRRRAISGLK